MAILKPFMEMLDDPLFIDKGFLSRPRRWVSAGIWLAGFAFMEWMQNSLQLGLAAVTVTLILTSALASLFLTPLTAVSWSLVAALLFNLVFIPSTGKFDLKLDAHHEVILVVALGVSLVVGALTSRLRILGLALQQHMGHLKTLNEVSNILNRSEDPATVASYVNSALTGMVGGHIRLVIAPDDDDPPSQEDVPAPAAPVSQEEQAAVDECMRTQEPVRFAALAICLPLTGQHGTLGAAVLRWSSLSGKRAADLDSAQTLCNVFGMALERAQRARKAAAASKAAFRREHSNLVLSAVSHEYRTPLTTILSHASQMKSLGARVPEDDRARMLDNIIEEVEHLRHVTSNMLQLARLDAQEFSLQWEWESIEDLIGSVLYRLRSRFPDWRPSTDLQPGLPLIRGDAVLLAQAFENLLDNARHYAGPTPPHVAAWSDRYTLFVAVMDRGPGIDPANQDRLFQMFERGRTLKVLAGQPDHERPQRMGTGVGLALCRAIMRAHGGSIAWKPREGGGSVFECQLPLPTSPAVPLIAPKMDDNHGP